MFELSPDGTVAFDRWIREAHELCRAVAGIDLADRPLYILMQSAVRATLGDAAGCDAYTTPQLDLHVQHHLADRWQGRGLCLIVNDLALLKDLSPLEIAGWFPALVLHELAHILDRPADLTRGVEITRDPERQQFETLAIREAISRPAPRIELPPYFGHEAGFIRICLHLRHRAANHGVPLAAGMLCAGKVYGLSHANRYQRALGNEPQQLAHRSFHEIRSLSPPSEFTQLWDADVRASRFTTLLKEPA